MLMNWKDHYNEIVKLRKEGKSYYEISKSIPCPESSVRKACQHAKLENINYCSEQDIKLILETYTKTKNIRRTTEITGFSRLTVRKYIRKHEINVPRVKTISASQSVVDWRRRTKEKLVIYKGGKCERCEYNKCIDALSFHHLDPSQKDFAISGKSWSYERLKNEVDKCMMLCSNCHIEVHAELKLKL